MVLVGGYASFFDLLFLAAGLLTFLLSESYLKKEGINFSEFYVLVLLSVAGMMLMGSSADLITLFLGVELMSVCFYVLAGFMRTRISSNEAAFKYFLLGAFSTGFLLYGIALIYGTTGSTNFLRIASIRPSDFVADCGTVPDWDCFSSGWRLKWPQYRSTCGHRMCTRDRRQRFRG